MKYGYARISSSGQKLSIQVELLKEAKCEKIYKEKKSGKNSSDRKEFQKLLSVVKEGDVIVVTKLDRFARSTKDALNTIDMLNEKGVGLIVLNMSGQMVDTTSSIGKLLITMLAGVAEFELSLIKERQLDGIQKAKERGVYKGRPKSYTDDHKGLQHALKLFNERDENRMSVNEICEITNVSRATLYREARKATV